jgi:hypothetical protein
MLNVVAMRIVCLRTVAPRSRSNDPDVHIRIMLADCELMTAYTGVAFLVSITNFELTIVFCPHSCRCHSNTLDVVL